jgi:hypothetical protein
VQIKTIYCSIQCSLAKPDICDTGVQTEYDEDFQFNERRLSLSNISLMGDSLDIDKEKAAPKQVRIKIPIKNRKTDVRLDFTSIVSRRVVRPNYKAGRKLLSYFGVVPLYLSVVPWYDKKYNLRSRVVLFNAI